MRPALRPAPAAADAARRVRAVADAVERARPVVVLVPIVAAQLAIALLVAARAEHNAWIYYTGGDGSHYWTASWALAHGWIPTAVASYGLPVFLWPLAYLVGDSLPAVLPMVVAPQVLLGGPLVVVCLYGIGSRIAGRNFGYLTAAGWALGPLVTLAYFQGGFRGDVRDLVVPNALGLTNLADFPSMVALVVAVWLLVRSFDTGAWSDLLLSALLVGFAVGIKPANAVFLPAPLVALAVAGRRRQLAGFALGLAPAMATLALWKWIGFGYLPGLSRIGTSSTPGATVSLPVVASLPDLPFSWSTFTNNLAELREVGWSLLLLEWIVVAGSFALVRKAPAKGALVILWLLTYVVLKGSAAGRSDVYQTTFFRLLVPAFPALVLLAAGTLLLVPTWGRRGAAPGREQRRPKPTKTLVVAAVVFGAYPLGMVALANASPRDRVLFQQGQNQSVPVSDDLHVTASEENGQTALRWRAPSAAGATLSYRIYRSRHYACMHHAKGGRDCLLRAPAVTTVRGTSWTDPDKGRWSYRIAVVADQHPEKTGGDMLLISPPVSP